MSGPLTRATLAITHSLLPILNVGISVPTMQYLSSPSGYSPLDSYALTISLIIAFILKSLLENPLSFG